MKSILILILALFWLICPVGATQDSLMPESETRKGTYIYKDTGKIRANTSSSIKRFYRDGKIFYKYTEQGKGNYDTYKDITWDIDSELEERDGLLYLTYSRRTIKDKKGLVVFQYDKVFDYEKGKIYCTSSVGLGKIIKKKTFPIKGYTTDNTTLTYFLKAFIARAENKAYRNIYLASGEPSLYRITIKMLPPEVLDIPGVGKIKALKLRLIPNFGILTAVTKALIPPTYLWYTEEAPYTWLQYQGLEAGIGTTHVIIYASDYSTNPKE